MSHKPLTKAAASAEAKRLSAFVEVMQQVALGKVLLLGL